MQTNLTKEKNTIKIQTTTEKIESKGGIILAGKIAVKIGLGKIKSNPVKNAGAVIAMIFGIMVEGKKNFESIGGKRESLLFLTAMGLGTV